MTPSIDVNVDEAKMIGEKIIKNMEGRIVDDYTLRKKDQVITLETKASIKINEENMQIDPNILFQRLLVAGVRSGN